MQLAEQINALRVEAGWLSRGPYTRHMDMDRLLRLLDEATTTIMDGAPYQQCDCPASQHDCPKCHGYRWTSDLNCRSLSGAV